MSRSFFWDIDPHAGILKAFVRLFVDKGFFIPLFHPETAAHIFKTRQRIRPEFLHGTANAVKGFFLAVPRLGEKFIRQTDKFLFRRLRQIITDRKRKPLFLYISDGKPASGVPFANPLIRSKIKYMFPRIIPQHRGADHPMGDIRFRPPAQDRRRVASANPDIVQHRPVRNKPGIQRDTGPFQNRQSLVADLFAVCDQKSAQRSIFRIKIPDYFKRFQYSHSGSPKKRIS